MKNADTYWSQTHEDALNDAYCTFKNLVGYHVYHGSHLDYAINSAWMEIEAQCDQVCRDLKKKEE
jgi:hypothetical protein